MPFPEFDNESTTLHSVDQNVAALEESIARPGSNEVDRTTTWHVVVFGVNIEETNLLDTGTSWVVRNRAHIQDAEARPVVGLVCETICNILVVINTFST
jgi:hypothetical protein